VIDADRDRGTAPLSPWNGAPRRREVDAAAPDATHRERRALPTQNPETQHMKDDLENSPWVAANRELVEMGFVRDSGRRRDGMIVWELTPLGWELAKPRADRHARNTAPLISPPSVTDPLQLATLANCCAHRSPITALLHYLPHAKQNTSRAAAQNTPPHIPPA
jgi:hypothetical protein